MTNHVEAIVTSAEIESPYLKPDAAAAYLGVSVSRLDRWAKDKKLEHYKMYDGKRFTVEQLDAFMSDRLIRAKK